MTRYAIGDIQGCHDSLEKLLSVIDFAPEKDQLWLVGDVVNRGPKSLETLRKIFSMKDSVKLVLGNHDLHLISLDAGCGKIRDDDTVNEILEAPDREALVSWLRAQPLMYVEDKYVMVHAGVLPDWTIPQAQACAQEVEAHLRGSDYRLFLENMYGSNPTKWNEELQGWERLRIIVNAFTRMRVCQKNGELDFKFKGEPKDLADNLVPWFKATSSRDKKFKVLFGHWSALGVYIGESVVGLDSGCVWGGKLTAIRLEDNEIFQVDYCG
ncbi:MAG: symmetrical bis(5'-nucleosyl)-tetraphosphatase [Ilumatobacteraceae bacterium]